MHIIVIGAGLAGLATAAMLARHGHQVTVLERAAEPRPMGAGLLLQPPGAAILEQLGCAGQVRQKAARITRLSGLTPDGRTLLDLDYSKLGRDVHGLGVTRTAIWSALLDCAQRAGAAVLGDQPVCQLSDGDTCVSVHIDGHTRPALQADLAVVASGTHSELWRSGGRHLSRPYAWGCLWGTVELPADWQMDTLGQRCQGTAVMLGILPIQDTPAARLGALYWSVRNDRIATLTSRPAQAWRDQVARTWPQVEPLVHDLEPSGMVHATYRDVWADPPGRGRIIAIGDTAHGTSPQLGQGTTQALRDATALADALDLQGDVAARLCAYWNARRASTRYYRMASRFLTPVFQSSMPGLGSMRDLLAGPVGRLPPVRHQALLTLAGAKQGLWHSDP